MNDRAAFGAQLLCVRVKGPTLGVGAENPGPKRVERPNQCVLTRDDEETLEKEPNLDLSVRTWRGFHSPYGKPVSKAKVSSATRVV